MLSFKWQERPIHLACLYNHADIARLLLERKCDFEEQTKVERYKKIIISHNIISVRREADTYSMSKWPYRYRGVAAF